MQYLWIIDILHELLAYISNNDRFSSNWVGDRFALLLRLILMCYNLVILRCGLILSIDLLVSGGLLLVELAYELLDVGNAICTTPWFARLLSWWWMRHGEE